MNHIHPRMAATLGLSLLTAMTTAALSAPAFGASPMPVLLVIANNDFSYADYAATRSALEARGIPVVVAAGELRVATPQGSGNTVRPDLAITAVSAHQYSAVAFVGGWGASQYQYAYNDPYVAPVYRKNLAAAQAINRLIPSFLAADKPVAAINHGVTVLAWARVNGASPLQGRTVVGPAGGLPAHYANGTLVANGVQPVRRQIEANGATMLTSESVADPLTSTDDVVVDGRIITAENYQAAGRFAELIALAIAERH